MKFKRLTPAFSMLELIFVIMILGIVASIGSEIVVRVYERYIVQRAQHRASLKTELAATQIANRLASMIPRTLFRIRDHDDFEPIESDFPANANGDDYIGFKWVGSDTESFNATATPGWSSFCDVDNVLTTSTSIKTPGSNLIHYREVIRHLSTGSDLTPRLYFSYDSNSYETDNIGGTGVDTITLGDPASHIVEHYKLARSSYALVVEDGDLYLYYNFPADTDAVISRNDTPKSLLMKNIGTFKFKAGGRTVRFKICKEENIGEDFNVTACKEKAVF